MGKIVRLTESDLVRIVKRVINEGASGPYTVGGKKYTLQQYQGEGKQIGYNDESMGTIVTDPKIVAELNRLSGFEIPTSSGFVNMAIIKNQKGKMPKLAAHFGL
jgi:hypothetical protein